jgi:hypothetical protein
MRRFRLFGMFLLCCLASLEALQALGPPCDWAKMAYAAILALLAIAWSPK